MVGSKYWLKQGSKKQIVFPSIKFASLVEIYDGVYWLKWNRKFILVIIQNATVETCWALTH